MDQFIEDEGEVGHEFTLANELEEIDLGEGI
jgi:hypothetical protein